MDTDLQRCHDELRVLKSVDMRKLEILKTKSKDAFQVEPE